MRGFGAALLTAVLLLAAGCGGDDGGSEDARPSITTVSKSLRSSDSFLGGAASQLDDQKATCIAKVLVGSDLSDKALKALLTGDLDYEPTSSEQAAMSPVMTEVGKCIQSK